MAHRQAALPRYVFERHTTVEVGAENFFGASLLPRGEPAPRRVRHRPHAAIGLSDMNPDRQGDVINKQPVGLLGMAQRRQYRTTEAGDRGIVDARGLLTVQVANSRGTGIIGIAFNAARGK